MHIILNYRIESVPVLGTDHLKTCLLSTLHDSLQLLLILFDTGTTQCTAG